MDLSEVTTKELLDVVCSRLDTCLILGITLTEEDGITFFRRLDGRSSWSLYGPLLAEIRTLNESFDEAEDTSGPENTVEF